MNIIEKTWKGWKVKEEIGRGSYGTVYKCSKVENGVEEYAAVKVISIPQSGYAEDAEKMSEEQTKEYYKDIADELIKEIEILKELKGTKNIVEIYDAEIIEKEDGIGWNILIRMELLTAFSAYSKNKKFTEAEVIRLGLDLSDALAVCHKTRIVHRDIKPENIFVASDGTFKLGDFGVAKQMEKTRSAMSIKGTYTYMSPEVFSGRRSDGRADMYSLALVMYKLLNNDRLPFLDPNKVIIRYNERQAAFERRIKGEDLPAISGISKELNAVILKACAFKNTDRQKNIDEFRSQLEKVAKGQKIRRNMKKSTMVKLGTAAASVVVAMASAFVGYAHFELGLFDSNKVADSDPAIISIYAKENGITDDCIDNKYLYKDENGIYLVDKSADTTSLVTTDIDTGVAFDGTNVVYADLSEDSWNNLSWIFYDAATGKASTDEDQIHYETEKLDVVYFDNEFVWCKDEDADGDSDFLMHNFETGKSSLVEYFIGESVLVFDDYMVFEKDKNEDDVASVIYFYDKKKTAEGVERLTLNGLFNEKSVFYKDGYLHFIEYPVKNDKNVNLISFNLKSGKQVATPLQAESDKILNGTVSAMNDRFICIENDNRYYLWSAEEQTTKEIKIKDKHGTLAECFTDPEITDKIIISFKKENSYDYYEVLKNGSLKLLDSIVTGEEKAYINKDIVYTVGESDGKTVKVYSIK